MDKLQLTPIDKALLHKNAANERDSQAAAYRIALVGSTKQAAESLPEVVEQRQRAGRYLRELREAQGFKQRRTSAAQRKARQVKAAARARRVYTEALDARAASQQNRVFNDLVDSTPVTVPTVKAPTLRVHNWRAPEGALRDRTQSQFKRTAVFRSHSRVVFVS